MCNLCAIQDMTRAEVLRLLSRHGKVGSSKPNRSAFSEEMARLAKRLIRYAADVAVLDGGGDDATLSERLDVLSHLLYEHGAAVNASGEVKEDLAHIRDVFNAK